MRYGILNSELGIAVIEGIEDLENMQVRLLEEQLPDGAVLNDLAFFYMPDRDWIVINKSHSLYEYYSELIPTYMELSADSRKKVRSTAPTDTIKEAFDILDGVIRRRSVYFPLEAIRIYPCFTEHPPKAEKMERKEQYFMETGLLQSQIILDSKGNLIDGYTSYLIAKAHGIQSVTIKRGKRQIVRVRHKSGGKLYTWELPGTLIDQVSVGDKVQVHTQRGIRTVRVAAVEEYAGQEQKPLRMVIKVQRKCSEKGGVA